MELKEMSATWAEVRVGDVMYRGTVKRVGSPVRSRSGRMQMVVEYDNGVTLVKDPETVCNFQRPIN